ncbi:MAG: hypothetical protein HFH09_01240 [Bacilli bacterium]|nr:hypothetical protein [Bacilli bacterium]
MKKGKWLVASLLVLLTMTGCGSKSLTCTSETNSLGMEMKSTISSEFKGDKLNSMKVTVDVKLPESMMSQKKTIMESFEKENTVKEAKVKETKDGFKVEGSADAKSLGTDNNAKYDDVKKTLESAGYKCK